MPEQPYDGSRLDRIERAIEHLLDVSARHDVHIAANQEQIAKTQLHLDALTVAMDRFQEEFQRDLKALLTAQVVLTDRVDRNLAGLAALVEAQKHTDERLNALIQVVDGFYRRQQG